MARKPTPTLLDETPTPAADEDVIDAPVAAIENAEMQAPVIAEAAAPTEPAPEAPAKPKRPARKKAEEAVDTAAAVVFEVVDNTGLTTESGEAVIEGAAESVEELKESPTPVDAALAALPSPLYKPMRTIILASLGLASYAVEETKFVVNKLVERGDLTQKEGAKLIGELGQKAKFPLPMMHRGKAKKDGEAVAEGAAEAAENVQTEASEVTEKLSVIEETFTDQPAEEQDETKQGKKKGKFKVRNIYTLNILSFGSPVNLDRKDQ